jgi:hypothetical protein
MPTLPVRLFVLAATSVLLSAAPALATPPGTRAVGMAGSLRGSATGDTALSLNPSGMSLLRTYVVEAAYLLDNAGGKAHNAHFSVVDSTSAFNVAGGVYYTYLTDSPEGGPGRSGHEGGVALSFPFGERFFVGVAAKYLRLNNDDPLPEGVSRRVSGFAFDLGATIKPIASLGIGLAATNLANADLGDRMPRTLGGGVTFGVTGELLLAFDAVYDITSSANKVWRLGGGAEFVMAKRFALRAGAGRRGDTKAGLLAGGFSLISDVAALDVGVQQDLAGARKQLLVGVSARVFVPTPTP